MVRRKPVGLLHGSLGVANGYSHGTQALVDTFEKKRVEIDIQRLLDRMAKADDDKALLGYARQVQALLLGEVSTRRHP